MLQKQPQYDRHMHVTQYALLQEDVQVLSLHLHMLVSVSVVLHSSAVPQVLILMRSGIIAVLSNTANPQRPIASDFHTAAVHFA